MSNSLKPRMTPQEFVKHLAFPGYDGKDISPKISLPIFQRDAVWKARQICELWDSLLRGLPLPALIMAPYVKEQAVKKSDNDEMLQEGDYYLIDGQQRALALLTGFGKLCKTQKLWLDLAWPFDKPEENHDRRFGFFLCSKARPWGSKQDLDSRPDSNEVHKARKWLYDNKRQELASEGFLGQFDFEIPLKYTWPVEAKAPIPFYDLLDWATKAQFDFTEEQLSEKCKSILNSNPPGEKCLYDIKGLRSGLKRLGKESITSIIADIDSSDQSTDNEKVDELLSAFTRLNRNGTQLKNDELYFSCLKQNMHCKNKIHVDELVSNARNKSEAFSELDLLHGFSVIASQTKKQQNKKREIPETDLSPDFLKSVLKQKNLGFKEKLLKDINRPEKITELIDCLKYKSVENGTDQGLPVVMLPRLKVHTWLPVFHWINTKEGEQLHGENRLNILRYVLTDHFFSEWYPHKNEMLRDILDMVADANSFPSVSEIQKKLEGYKKLDGNAAWLKVVYIDQKGINLPLSKAEWNKWFACRNSVFQDDGKIWAYGRRQDFLMWAQREAMDEWFGNYLSDLAMLGEIGQPWDRDHLVPSKFFRSLDESIKKWRDSTGNFRLWPYGFNRSDGDKSLHEKLETIKLPDPHIVLSHWVDKKLKRPEEQEGLFAKASALNHDECWKNTPANKDGWNKDTQEKFLSAVKQREESLYVSLLDFISPPEADFIWGEDRLKPENIHEA